MKQVQLFGGSIIANVKENFKDVSDIRPIPDHQEVFLALEDTLTGAPPQNVSLIVEILDMESIPSDIDAVSGEAIRYYFKDLATSNESSSDEIISTGKNAHGGLFPLIVPPIDAFFLVGKQNGVNSETGNDVQLVLILLRLAHVQTDILITLHLPVESGSVSDHLLNSPCRDSDEIEGDSLAVLHVKCLRSFLNSFEIIDWSLFSPTH